MGRRRSFTSTESATPTMSIDEAMMQQVMGLPQVDNARIVMLHGELTEYSVSQVMAHILHHASQGNKPIKLVVSSYGGSVHELFGLIDLMRSVNSPIHTIGLGKIMSAGAVITAAGTKGHRMIGASTRVMIHSMSGGAVGTMFQMENEMKEQRVMQETIERILLRDTSITKKQLDDIMKQGHDHYYTAQEALKLGIADKIIGV
jgi:ATP-dependent Clp protease protease subunit